MTARFTPPWPPKSPWPSPSILSLRTMRRPGIGLFQMPGWTVLPRHVISRGKPMLTDTSRAANSPPNPLPTCHQPFGLPTKTSRMLRVCHRRKNFLLFEPQTFRDEDAVQSVEEELHQQGEQSGGNCALQNGAGVIQIEPADNGFSQSTDPDERGKRRGTDVNDGAGFYPRQNRA